MRFDNWSGIRIRRVAILDPRARDLALAPRSSRSLTASFCGRSISLHPDRIVVIRETNLPQFPEYLRLTTGTISIGPNKQSPGSHAAAYSRAQVNLTGEGRTAAAHWCKATAHYFDVYQIKPVLGAHCSCREEDAPGKDHVVVLSHAFWRRVFRR